MHFPAGFAKERRECAVLCLVLICVAAAQQTPSSPAAPPLRLTMQDALARARRNSVTYQAAITDAGVAHEDKNQARAALLPSVTYNTSGIYTEGNGVDGGIKFIANNAVHEYSSQGNVHEAIDVAGSRSFDVTVQRRQPPVPAPRSPRAGWWLRSCRLITAWLRRN